MFKPTTEKIQHLSDEEVLLRARSEPWLFAVLLERYQDAFLRKAKSILYDVRDAEEVVQDAFTKIYVNAGKFERRKDSTFSSWAYAILINTAFTRYSKCKREGKRTIELVPEIWEMFGTIEHHSGFKEDRDAIERVFTRLPEQFAYVLRLHYIERWSQRDIAEDMGKTVGATKALIHRAKDAFRKHYQETVLKDI